MTGRTNSRTMKTGGVKNENYRRGKKVEIKIRYRNGSGYGPDWSIDYFNAGSLPYNEATDTYTVDDVAYCIDMANAADEEGACSKYDLESGKFVRDDDMSVFVTEL